MSDKKETILLAVLALAFAGSVGGLVNAIIKQTERDSQPQSYIITIEYKSVTE